MSTTVELHRKDAELQDVRAELVALRAGVERLCGWGVGRDTNGVERMVPAKDLRALLGGERQGVSCGLMCVVIVESGRLCACESHQGVPSALPFMNKHGEAACQCHPETAAKYGVTPFPCNATTDAES